MTNTVNPHSLISLTISANHAVFIVTHFSMWAILKSPLILGNDLTSMVSLYTPASRPISKFLPEPSVISEPTLLCHTQSDETFSIISNEQLISINQDPMGSAAFRVWKKGDLQLWVGNLVEW